MFEQPGKQVVCQADCLLGRLRRALLALPKIVFKRRELLPAAKRAVPDRCLYLQICLAGSVLPFPGISQESDEWPVES